MKKHILACLDWLCYLAGIYGVFFFLCTLEDFSFQRQAVGIVTFLAASAFWILKNQKKKTALIMAVFLILFVAGCAMTYGQRALLFHTWCALLIMLVVCMLIWIFFVFTRNRILLNLITTVMILAPPFLGGTQSTLSVILLLLFQVMFTASALIGRGWKKEHTSPDPHMNRHILALTGGCCLGLLLIASCTSLLFEEELFSFAYQAEGAISRSLQELSGRTDPISSGGEISRGNNYRTGEVQMEVHVSRLPEETLYLKGFTGDTYTGNRWEPVGNEEELFDDIEKQMGWDGWSRWIHDMLENGPFTYFSSGTNMPQTIELEITPQKRMGTYYAPYYSRWTGYGEDYQSYLFSFFESSDRPDSLNIRIDASRRYFEWLQEISNAYLSAAQKYYTEVPEEILPRLTELCREHPLKTTGEVTEFILDTLWSETSYSLTPGFSSFTDDIVESFLFDRKEGCCVHYASTAALMYRMYGIPARYVSGYAVSPDQFQKDDVNGYRAQVTDESAHAWVEIYQAETGWIPVEVTPSSGQTQEITNLLAEVPDRAKADERPGASGQTSSGNTEEDEEDSNADTDSQEAEEEGISFRLSEYFHVWYLIPALAFIVILVLLRRTILLKRAAGYQVRQSFGYLILILHACGKMKSFHGAEADFADILKTTVPVLKNEEIRSMMAAVNAAAYGDKAPSEEENVLLHEICQKTVRFFYASANPFKKFLLRFWNAFL